MVARLHLGVYVGADVARAIALDRRDTIVWAGERTRGAGESAGQNAHALLLEVPRPYRRAVVTAACGPSLCQFRRLADLPPGIDATTAHAAVRENVARFYLKNGVPLAVGTPGRHGDEWWGTVYEESAVAAIEDACRARHLRLRAIVAAAALPGASPEQHAWVLHDGSTTVEVTHDDGGRRRVRSLRSSGDSAAVDQPTVPEPRLAAAGLGAMFHLALRAARAGTEPGALWPGPRPIPSWRWTSAVGVLAASLAFLTLVGPIAWQIRTRRDVARLAQLRPAAAALAQRAELARFTSALSEFEALTGDAPRLDVLAAVTAALPDSAAVVNLRMQDSQLEVTAVAPAIRVLLDRIERSNRFDAPRLTSTVVREQVAGQERERGTITTQIR